MGNNLSLAISIAVPLGIGMVIGVGMRDEVREWYPTIKKPIWTPPNWLFGPVWTALYCMMGYAANRVASVTGLWSKPMLLYGSQLVLNFLWSPLFFKYHKLGAAAIDITALLGVLYATIIEFGAVDTLCAQLLLPYLGWSCYATALTYNIYLNN
jgi:benzodiazapine receptor